MTVENESINMGNDQEPFKANVAVITEDENMGDLTKCTKKFCKTNNSSVKEFLAEIAGTFIMLVFGLGSVAQLVLGKGNHNSILSVNIAWSFAVTMGILVAGKISGAHMNCSISFCMVILGKMKFKKFFIYVAGQIIGALLASIAIYIVYLDAINHFDGGVRQTTGPNATAGIWVTSPADSLSSYGAFIDQVFGTMILVFLVLTISEKRLAEIPFALSALLVGFVVFVIGLSLGFNCGYPINPIRDFIPRIFLAFAGWGTEVFKVGNYYFWVPLIAPFIGGVLAVYLFAICIGNHLQDSDNDNINSTQNSV